MSGCFGSIRVDYHVGFAIVEWLGGGGRRRIAPSELDRWGEYLRLGFTV